MVLLVMSNELQIVRMLDYKKVEHYCSYSFVMCKINLDSGLSPICIM